LASTHKTRVAIFGAASSGEPALGVAGTPLFTVKLDNCNVLITGASAGIGREFARQLAGRARSLILVARREDRLAELRDELQQHHPNLAVQIRQVDLADPVQLQELMDWFDRENINVDLLINNAGLGDSGPFATSDRIRNEAMTLLNVVALTSLTRHVLPQMIAKRRGGILNVSSSAGFLPVPGSAVYAATKAYVTSFSEALRAELHGTGISVCALCPGPVRTEFQQVARRPDGRPEIGPEFVLVPVEQVVRDAINGLEADRPIVIPGFAMKVAMLLARLTPMPVIRLVMQLSRRTREVV
jgi:Short-chain dehydrogenases of various substrate specificities